MPQKYMACGSCLKTDVEPKVPYEKPEKKNGKIESKSIMCNECRYGLQKHFSDMNLFAKSEMPKLD